MAYHAELGAMNYITAKSSNVNALTLPSETIFATKLRVLTFFGIPRYVLAGGLNMDADYLMQVVKAKDGNADTVRQYMLSSGMTSSALEHSVPEQLFSTPSAPIQGISTVKALKIANDQGIPIYTINQQNITTALPQLQVGQYVKEDIQNAVNAGKVVTVSKTNINFNGWVGCGYIITNPETGGGAYMISGGTNGADVQALLWLVEILLYTLAAAGVVAIALLAIIFAGVPGAFAATLPTFASAIASISEFVVNASLFASAYYESLPILAKIIATIIESVIWFNLTGPSPVTGAIPSDITGWMTMLTVIRINLYFMYKEFIKFVIDFLIVRHIRV